VKSSFTDDDENGRREKPGTRRTPTLTTRRHHDVAATTGVRACVRAPRQTHSLAVQLFTHALGCHIKTPFTRYNRLSSGLTTGLTTVLNEQLFIQTVVKPGCTTGLTNTV